MLVTPTPIMKIQAETEMQDLALEERKIEEKSNAYCGDLGVTGIIREFWQPQPVSLSCDYDLALRGT